MKNLTNSKLVCFDFHKSIIDSKQIPKTDLLYKNRLLAINSVIETLFKTYDSNFKINAIETTVPHNFIDQDKTDLLSLYRYKSKLIQNIKNEVTTTVTKRIISTCQNCTINAVNSCDHILPKDEFCEFVVNPLNLFPSCTECNSYKSTFWQQNGKRLFLNLYLDILPEIQYLFVDIKFVNDTFETRFYLENRFGIDPDLYQLIESHYRRLHLCNRFASNIDVVITPLINNIKPYLNRLPINEIIDSAVEGEDSNRNSFGFNYWQSILTIALLQNKDFINYVQNPKNNN